MGIESYLHGSFAAGNAGRLILGEAGRDRIHADASGLLCSAYYLCSNRIAFLKGIERLSGQTVTSNWVLVEIDTCRWEMSVLLCRDGEMPRPERAVSPPSFPVSNGNCPLY
jgi:hypothetical protein